MFRLLIIFTTLVLLLAAFNVTAQDDHGHDHDEATEAVAVDEHDDHDEHEDEFVVMTAASMAEFGVSLDTAGPGSIRSEIDVPGEIAVNGDRIAHIVPRFSGVVQRVLKRVGDQVHTGDVLAVVESNEGLTPFDVKALMDGTVIEKNINLGEVHHSDSPAYIIADLDTVWVNLSIYQRHLAEVRVGQPATISFDHGVRFENGVVSYVSPIVDKHTRTATARVVLDNRSGDWRPGLLVEGRIATSSYAATVAVPKTAVFHLNDADVVFVLTAEGFHAQSVQIGRTNHANAEITHGLEAGQVYASRGGFTIKAEMQKGSFGDGHGH